MNQAGGEMAGGASPEPQYMVRLGDGRDFGPATLAMIEQWGREGRVPVEALLVPRDGSPVRSVLAEARLRLILSAPPTVAVRAPMADEGPMAVMIPYRNPQALIGYYTAIGSLIPVVGAIAGPVAIVLGIMGIRNYQRDPRVRGLTHSWVAIIGGVIGILISLGCVVIPIIAAISNP